MTYPVFVSGDVLTASDMNKVGMWLVTTNTFTSVTSVTINNCFTSDYKNYKLFFNPSSVTGTGYATIQFTIGGTATTTNYISKVAQFHTAANGWELADNAPGTDELPCGVVGATSTGNIFTEITIGSPQLAQVTKVSVFGPGNFGANPLYLHMSQGCHTASTAFDGIKFNFSGSASGTINIYGLRD